MTDTATGLKTLLDAAPSGAKTYALMDCALDSTILGAIAGSGCASKCLYTLPWQSELSDLAPYVVELDPTAAFSSTLLTWDWYANWGVFAQSSETLDDVAQSFAALTVAQMPDGESAFFRFYDPRVLRPFLGAATSTDLSAVFAKAQRFVVPMMDDGYKGEGAIVYTLSRGQLTQTATRFQK